MDIVGWLWVWGPSIVGILVGLAGLHLLITGAAPARIGHEPYCKACGYNLSGSDLKDALEPLESDEDALPGGAAGADPALQTRTMQGQPGGAIEWDAPEPRCSECGAELGPREIRIGRRVRRPARALAGMALMLGVGAAMYGVPSALYRRDLYERLPTWWVLLDLRYKHKDLAERAATELSSRLDDGLLSAAQKSRLIDACLAHQADVDRRPVSNRVLNLLAELYRDMSAAQRERFFANAFRIDEVFVRPIVRAGSKIPWQLKMNLVFPNSWPSPDWSASIMVQSVAEGVARSEAMVASNGGGSRTSGRRDPLPVGDHLLTIEVLAREHAGTPFVNDPARDVLHRREARSLPVRVVESGELVALKRDPELDAAIAAGAKLENVHWLPPRGGEIKLHINFALASGQPIAQAFDAYADLLGKPVKLTRVRAAANAKAGRSYMNMGPLPPDIPSTFDILLIPSREAAEETVDMFEIWGGTLGFRNVTPAASAAAANASPVTYSATLDPSPASAPAPVSQPSPQALHSPP